MGTLNLDDLDDVDLTMDFAIDGSANYIKPNEVVAAEPFVRNESVVTNVAVPTEPIEHVSMMNNESLAKSALFKLNAIKNELKGMFFERDLVIDNAIIALAIGESMLLLGPPGTAKSDLTRELCSRIDGSKYFSWLMNRSSDPSEILGPFSVKAMEQDRFVRIPTGKLPEANIVFLDEIFKCNEPTLNVLLPLINEKIFFNDGVAQPVPLVSLFAASNEFPEDESLDALYDRLIFRMWIDYIGDRGNEFKMYERYLMNRAGGSSLACKTTIEMDELKALSEEAKSVIIDKSTLKSFSTLLTSLEKQHITISDRRKNQCLKVLQGTAALSGRKVATTDDFQSLIYVLWKDKDDIDVIRKEIVKIANPYDSKTQEFRRKFEEIKKDLESERDSGEKIRKSIESKGSFESIIKKLNSFISESNVKGKNSIAMENLRSEIIKYNQEIISSSLGININSTGSIF